MSESFGKYELLLKELVGKHWLYQYLCREPSNGYSRM